MWLVENEFFPPSSFPPDIWCRFQAIISQNSLIVLYILKLFQNKKELSQDNPRIIRKFFQKIEKIQIIFGYS